MNKQWEKISSSILVNHKRLRVVEDIVKLPNGKTTDYIKFEGDYGASTVIAIRTDGKILLQKEYSYPPNEILLQFPGGGINKNEAPIEAAHRELSEEANLDGAMKQIGWFYTDNRRKDTKMHVFVATDLEEKIGDKDDEEDLESVWFTEEEIDNLVSNGELVIYSALAAWAIYKSHVLK